jgi:hypothetical protein
MAFVEHLVSKCLAEGSGWLGAVSDSVRQFGEVAGNGKMIDEDVISHGITSCTVYAGCEHFGN